MFDKSGNLVLPPLKLNLDRIESCLPMLPLLLIGWLKLNLDRIESAEGNGHSDGYLR